MRMFKYAMKRIAMAVITFAIIMLVCFILVKAAPIVPFLSYD